MSSISGFLSETINALGQTFIIAYYLPAVLFLLVQTQVFAPMWSDHGDTQPQIVQAPPVSQETEKIIPPATPEALSNDPNPPTSPAEVAPTPGPDWLANLGEELFSILIFLVAPFLLGMILLGLNDLLIVGFEGKQPWLRNGLFARWTNRNRERSRSLYNDLLEQRTEYARLQGEINVMTSPDKRLRSKPFLVSLTKQIGQTHDDIERSAPVQSLPRAEFRIGPNRFGNLYAVAEEYVHERYGIDPVLFWGRLRTLMEEKAPTLTGQLVQQKTLIDLSINLSFLACLVLIESIVMSVALVVKGALTAPWLADAVQEVLVSPWLARLLLLTGVAKGVFAISWLMLLLLLASAMKEGLIVPWSTLLLLIAGSAGVTTCFYHVAVGRVELLGELIKQSYDFHRHLVLESFGLKKPISLADERYVWMRLTAFIRRGDEFYFPVEFQIGRDAQSVPETSAQTTTDLSGW